MTRDEMRRGILKDMFLLDVTDLNSGLSHKAIKKLSSLEKVRTQYMKITTVLSDLEEFKFIRHNAVRLGLGYGDEIVFWLTSEGCEAGKLESEGNLEKGWFKPIITERELADLERGL